MTHFIIFCEILELIDWGWPPVSSLATPKPTLTPEVVAISMLPETGGRPGLLPSFPGLSLMTMTAVLVLLALLKREGRHSDGKED